MSLKAMPLLYLNLGGEMMYIIEQRLNAQNICRIKSERVINDILKAMFDEPFVASLFTKQPLKDREYINHLFHRVVHSSIMKLNDQSMAKLLELMAMVFKQQLVFCLKPTDLYDITLNHLESVTEMSHSNEILEMIKGIRDKIITQYSNVNEIEMQFIRQTLLTYFGDVKTRVSVFIHDGTQESDGTFVLANNNVIVTRNQIPGTIVHFDDSGEVLSQSSFQVDVTFKRDVRRTLLGLNIYGKEENESKESETLSTHSNDNDVEQAALEATKPNPNAYESIRREKQLLSALLGKQSSSNVPEHGLWIDFDENEAVDESKNGVKFTEIKADNNRSNFAKINEEFTIQEQGTSDDILDIIDSIS